VIDANGHLKQPHMFFVTEALAVLRFRHMSHHFLKPGDFADMSISKVLHFEVWGCWMPIQRVAWKTRNCRC